MIVGCPGSGKSRLSKLLGTQLNIPVLHLDYIYHIDNFHQISRNELKTMIQSFVESHESFIIDGNYNATMEWRLQFCDTVVLLDIETDICVENVLKRMDESSREDMAPQFDNSIMDEDFLDFVKTFKTRKLPGIKELLLQHNKSTVVLTDYDEVDSFLKENEKTITCG